MKLPEVEDWQRKHKLPVAFLPLPQNTSMAPDGRCVLQVGVYADRPERYEAWNWFYTDLSGKRVRWVMNLEGDLVSLSEWRKAQASLQKPSTPPRAP